MLGHRHPPLMRQAMDHGPSTEGFRGKPRKRLTEIQLLGMIAQRIHALPSGKHGCTCCIPMQLQKAERGSRGANWTLGNPLRRIGCSRECAGLVLQIAEEIGRDVDVEGFPSPSSWER